MRASRSDVAARCRARLRRLTPRQWLLLLAALLGIGAVELGMRQPVFLQGSYSSEETTLARARSIPSQFIADPTRAAIVTGVVFGQTGELDMQTRDAFLRSGLWHLLAASGQNVALVAAVCAVSAYAVGGGRLLASVWGMAAVPAYALVAGAQASVVRAAIMAEVALLAWLLGRLHDVRDAMLVSGAIIVWVSPGSHRTLGFQLSYACVAALLYGARPLTVALRAQRVPRWLAAGIAATVLCSLATAPLLFVRTGGSPALGSVMNLVAVPAASVILVTGLVATMLAPVAGLVARPLFSCAELFAGALQWSADVGARLPGAYVDSAGALGVTALVALLVSTWLFPQWRRWACMAGAGVSLLTLGSAAAARHAQVPMPPPGVLRISFLDVGQGDSVLVQHAGRAVLLDTGTAEARVARTLRTFGVRRLDAVVLTHNQLDHSGGFTALHRSIDVGWVGIPAIGSSNWQLPAAVRPHRLCRGDQVTVARVVIHVLHPACAGRPMHSTGDEANDNAVVVHVRLGSFDAALTADAEAGVLARIGLPRVELLKVSHHGSADPFLAGLLQQVQPEVAAISVGKSNPFGHPRSETLAALHEADARVWRTDRHGTLIFETDGRRMWRVEA